MSKELGVCEGVDSVGKENAYLVSRGEKKGLTAYLSREPCPALTNVQGCIYFVHVLIVSDQKANESLLLYLGQE